MIKFRAAARAWLKGSDGNRDLRDKLDVSQDASNISWEELWADICFNEDSETSYVSIHLSVKALLLLMVFLAAMRESPCSRVRIKKLD